MKNAEEFEKLHHRTPVRLAHDAGVSGVLVLEGLHSALHLTGMREMWHHPDTKGGWFDLVVETPKGSQILLKNSIITNSQTFQNFHSKISNHSATIFPNFIIEDYQNLGSDDKVGKISFSIPKMFYFFYYKYVETLDGRVIQNDHNLIASLREARYDSTSDSFFNPSTIYVAHDLPKVISFEVSGRIYEIGFGGKETLGLHKIGHEQFPIASIQFDAEVPFETALESAWSWKRIFSQLDTSKNRLFSA